MPRTPRTESILAGPLCAVALFSWTIAPRADDKDPTPQTPVLAGPAPPPATTPPARPRVRLAYGAPAGCPDEAAFVAAVAAQARPFERAPRSAARARSLEATITRTEDGHAGVLRVREAGGATSERAVGGDTCAEVFSALALVAALTVDTGPPPPNPPPVDPPPPPPALPLRWRWATAVHGGAFFSMAPVASFGVAPALEATPPIRGAPLAVRLGVTLAASPRADTPAGSAEFFWLTARLGVSPVALSFGPLTLRPTVDLGAGVLRGRGLAISKPRETARPWADVTVGGRAEWMPSEALGLELAGGVMVPITRVTWTFETPPAVVHETPPVGGYLTLGLRVVLAQ